MKNKIVFLHVLIFAAAISFIFSVVTEAAHKLTPHEQLGKSIFFDKNLSVNRNQSCASCHDPAAGWTGPDSEINAHGAAYKGSIEVRFGDRKPPSAAYAAVSPLFHFEKREGHFIGGNFWDGRATGEKLGNAAADQAQGPFLNPVEQALPDPTCVVYRVCTAKYPSSLESVNPGECDIAWPMGIDINKICEEGGVIILSNEQKTRVDEAFNAIALAIAAYEASPEVNPYTSKFDYFLKGEVELTVEERKGLDLFNEKGKCADCHISDGKKPLFTDFTYDNLGIPINPENPVYKNKPGFIDKGLEGFLGKLENPREWRKLARENTGKHKVPTLRNVDKRPDKDFVKSYMHNGYFKTLKGLVHFYNTRDTKPACSGPLTEAQAIAAECWPGPEVKENVNKDELGNLGLTDEEEDAIVSFMRTLSDGFVPEKGNEPLTQNEI
jgi:cytochrome c peroxidase